jgi:hypothetical protein
VWRVVQHELQMRGPHVIGRGDLSVGDVGGGPGIAAGEAPVARAESHRCLGRDPAIGESPIPEIPVERAGEPVRPQSFVVVIAPGVIRSSSVGGPKLASLPVASTVSTMFGATRS